MDLGIALPAFGRLAGAEALAAVAERAEALGFASVWVADHVAVPVAHSSRYPYSSSGRATFTAESAWLDPFLALSWAGAATKRVGLGTSVLVLPLRPPLLVAKAAATLDHLSGGRVILGVGAGWLREEFDILGVPFASRGRDTTAAIRTLRQCWGSDPVDTGGPLFTMAPKPPGRLPVLCGGHSDAALRRVVEVSDGWHPIIDPDTFARRRSELERLMAGAGRPMSELWLTVRPGRERPATPELLERYAQGGATLLVLSPDYSSGLLATALADLERLAGLIAG